MVISYTVPLAVVLSLYLLAVAGIGVGVVDRFLSGSAVDLHRNALPTDRVVARSDLIQIECQGDRGGVRAGGCDLPRIPWVWPSPPSPAACEPAWFRISSRARTLSTGWCAPRLKV